VSDYTPTTEDIRAGWEYATAVIGDEGTAQFDRWLAEVKAQVWEEGFDAGERDVHEHELTHWDDSDCIQNPYRQGEEHV